MNKDKDYYKILGIHHDSDNKEIKKNYRELARKFHPDVNPGNRLYEEKFKEIGEAYSILVDKNKRRQYDTLRGIIKPQSTEQAKKQASKAYSGQKPGSATSPKKEKETENVFQKDIGNFFTGFANKFAQKEKKPKEEKKVYSEVKKPSPKKGEDITTEINITIAEAHNGAVRKVNILRTETCPKCRGKRVINSSSCQHCSGKGELSNYKQLNVKIPAKVKESSKIRITGEGNKGLNGGENGDLYLLIHIIKNANFTFDGLNVHCEIPITPTEAALGAEIQTPSINGFINLKIPAETRSGQKFKLAGEGLPDTNSNKRGDQIVAVKIEMPQNLTAKEKNLYKELANLRKFNPRENIIFEK